MKTLGFQRNDLLLADRTLGGLGAVDWPGLAALDADRLPQDRISAEILAHAPQFALAWRVHGEEPAGTAPPEDLFTVIDAGLRLYEAQPRLICWPCVIPTLRGGTSLLDLPQIILTPGDFLYLTATWTFDATRLQCAAPELFFSAQANLQDRNDLSAFAPAGTTTRTWTFNVGLVDKSGTFTSTNLGNLPYIPPPLL